MIKFLKSDPEKNGKEGLLKLTGSMDIKEADEMLKAIEDGIKVSKW